MNTFMASAKNKRVAMLCQTNLMSKCMSGEIGRSTSTWQPRGICCNRK
jgi:hypothetical protein